MLLHSINNIYIYIYSTGSCEGYNYDKNIYIGRFNHKQCKIVNLLSAYANIFMGRLENQLLMSVTLKPFSWLRFIDDIDMKWTHGRDSLEDFLQRANSFHPTIKFTAEESNEEHIFLDTKSCLVDGRIVVDLYTKPTDTHQYLLPSSCHPKHCSKNIPYSLALRLRRICTDTETFALRSKELTD